jgi:4Fe-4S binding protein
MNWIARYTHWLARVRFRPGLAALHLEHLLLQADALVARHRVPPDLRAHSDHHPQVGKGAYCGWICSCGALAETMGDAHRQKMPHGPLWNRVNMVGQAALVDAVALFFARVISWSAPNTGVGRAAEKLFSGLLSGWSVAAVELNYYHVVDIFLAGIVGVGMYFWFSGRAWCRFACPIAALMHIFTRFSRFGSSPRNPGAFLATSARRSATRESTS